MDDNEKEYDIGESLRSFRRAASRVIEGIKHIYHGGKKRVADQHATIQGVITIGLWFAGNWVYNFISPLIVDTTATVVSNVPAESVLMLVGGLFRGELTVSTAQLLGASTGALLGQNRFQTQKLKRIEVKLSTMSETRSATDGGTPEAQKVGGGGLGGAIAGGSLGISFGPGGVLAGVYLGYVLGERLTKGGVPGRS